MHDSCRDSPSIIELDADLLNLTVSFSCSLSLLNRPLPSHWLNMLRRIFNYLSRIYILLQIASIFVCKVSSNYCAENSLPYHMSVHSYGSLAMDCAQVKCVNGVDQNANKLADQRSIGDLITTNVGDEDNGISAPTTNKASSTLISWSTPCDKGQISFKDKSLPGEIKQCSYFENGSIKLIGHKLVHSGEKFTGGQVLRNGRLVAFDFISSVRRLRDRDRRFKYLVTTARMTCASEHAESSNHGMQTVSGDSMSKGSTSDSELRINRTRGNSLSTDERRSSKLTPPPLSNDMETSASPPTVVESLAKNNDSQEHDDSTSCFTSPSGHRCCSREVETLLKQMSMVISSEMTSDDNETTIYHSMFHYIKNETTKKFCTPFETIISKGEFAAKSHTNGTHEQDGIALGCKMQVKIGGSNRIRRADDVPSNKEGHLFIVLTYSTVVNANDKNSKSITYPEHPELPPPPPPSNLASSSANSGSSGNSGNSGSSGNSATGLDANSGAFFANAAFPPALPPPIVQPPPVVQPPLIVQPIVQPPIPPAADDRTCFSDDGIVETESGVKRMDELVVGDNVLATYRRSPSFAPVTSFIHRLPKQRALFYQIHTLYGASITLTGNHFIYITDCFNIKSRRIHAANVQIGECVFQWERERKSYTPTPVTNVTKVWRNGIYAPLTSTGTITVNNILASCHSSIDRKHMLHHSYFYWIDTIQSWMAWTAGMLGPNMRDNEVDLLFGTDFLIEIMDLVVPKFSVSY